MNPLESLSRLCAAVEKAGADIAPTYAEYVQLTFAITTDCGESGRTDFHRLCSLSSKYDRKHADHIFTNALATGLGNVHLGTAFHLAEQAGIKLPYEEPLIHPHKNAENAENADAPSGAHTRTRVNKEQNEEWETCEELQEGSDPQKQLPTFPQSDWPQLLSQVIGYGDSATQRDAMLLGAFTVLGASMERYVCCRYSHKDHSPCLQTFVVAPSASGKGVLSFIRLLIDPIHDELRSQSAQAFKAYKKERMAYESQGKDRSKQEEPEMPKNKMFLISGNNTGTGILENIMDADGTGLIFEAEADTISSAIGSEYGHWSDTLRKAFDHDRISYNRRTDHEYREVKNTFLSVLLSGTPAQVKPLIPSAENGLFSRQLFYYMHGIDTWVDQFGEDDIDLEAIFRDLGKEWKQKLDQLKAHGLHILKLTEQQHTAFNDLFSDLFFRSGLANDNEMSSSIARLAVNTCRILSEVAVLRALERKDPYCYQQTANPLLTPDKEISPENVTDGIISRWNVTITPPDFEAVMGLVVPLYCHATHILSFLPSTEVKHRSNVDRDNLFDHLAGQFTRSQLLEEAEILHIKSNTAISWLGRLLKKGLFVKGEKGLYTRARVCGR